MPALSRRWVGIEVDESIKAGDFRSATVRPCPAPLRVKLWPMTGQKRGQHGPGTLACRHFAENADAPPAVKEPRK